MTTAIGRILPFFSFFLFLADIIYVMVVMFMVYRHIQEIEKKAQAYAFSSFRISLRTSQTAKRKRSRRIMIQGLMYAVAMLLVFLPLFVYFLCLLGGVIGSFALEMVFGIFVPLQGMYNAFIYSGKLQHWFYNHENQYRRWQCCSCVDVSFSSLHTSIKRQLYSIFDKSVEDDSNQQEKSEGKDKIIGIRDSVSPGLKVNTESSLENGVNTGEIVAEKRRVSIHEAMIEDESYDDIAEKGSISIHEDMVEEEKEEITAQFPIHVPCSKT